MFAFDDAYFLGLLSSRIHVIWSLASGGHLGVGNDPRYNKKRCFETFAFPTVSEAQQTRIRELGEALDAHRKRQQAQHADLTLTDIYNVLEKLRAGTALTAREQVTHEEGLVSVLRQLHDDLDAAVAAAYGLPVTATDEEILAFLCKLNAERAAEERSGLIRWLRPSFQHPEATTTQATMGTTEIETAAPAKAKIVGKLAWPKTLAEQAQCVTDAMKKIFLQRLPQRNPRFAADQPGFDATPYRRMNFRCAYPQFLRQLGIGLARFCDEQLKQDNDIQ